MIYQKAFTLAAAGSSAAPTRETLTISRGLVWLMEVDFPAGCVGLVHLRIYDGSYQLLPASPGESLIGDDIVLKYDDLYLKENPPSELTLEGWNSDSVYPHTLQVRIGVATSRAFQARYLPTITWDEMSTVLKETELEQEAMKAAQLDEILQTLKNV